jgi:hypothetical protein
MAAVGTVVIGDTTAVDTAAVEGVRAVQRRRRVRAGLLVVLVLTSRAHLLPPARAAEGFVLLVRPAREVQLEVVGTDQILDVQERRALLPHVDEGRLHAGQDTRDLAQHDVADRAAMRGAFNLKLRNDAALDQRYASFPNINVDDDNAASHSIQSGARSSTRHCFGESFPGIDQHSIQPHDPDPRPHDSRPHRSRLPFSKASPLKTSSGWTSSEKTSRWLPS